MAEFATEDATVTDLLVAGVARDPGAAVFAIPDSFGSWFDLTGAEFLDRVRALARGFLAADLHSGDALAVLCSTRFEATLIDFAAAAVGVAVVPLAPGASQSELMGLLDAAQVRAVVVESARDFARIDELQGDLPLISDVWQIGLGDLDKLAGLGRSLDDSLLDGATTEVTGDAVAALFADEAADGSVRLIRITQGALAARAAAIATILEDETGADASTLQILPATDVHARVTTLVAVVTGTRLGHLADPARFLETMASFRPTLLVAYPATLDRIDEAAHARADATGRAAALRQGLEVAVDHSVALSTGTVARGLKTRFALADALVYRGLRKAVGARLRTVVAIATEVSLPPRLRHIMRSLDVRALEGFGTADTTGFATLERPSDPFERPVGGVGAPLAGVEVAVDADGSVAFRGVGVEANEDDGWLRTDQFGALEDGRLVVEGRDLDVAVSFAAGGAGAAAAGAAAAGAAGAAADGDDANADPEPAEL